MEIQDIKSEIKNYLSTELEPIYEEYKRTNDKKVLKDLDEKLEVLQSKIDVLYQMDEIEGEDFYIREIGTLPTKETLLSD